MAGLLGDVYSAADQVKRRVKGLLTDPRGFMGTLNEDARTHLDQMRALAYQNDPNRERAGLLFPQQARNEPAFNDQQAEIAKQRLADIAMQGLTVWHGSPHKFDKFDSSKIGTGEGAQAYGHGLYLAEKPEVAMEYQNLKPIVDPTDTGFIQARAAWAEAKGNAKKALAYLDKQEKIVADAKDFLMDKGKSSFADIAKARELITSGQMTPGNLYKVDLPDSAIERMLDWDKPLSQQPENMKKAIESLGVTPQSVGKLAADKVRALANKPGLADWAKRDLLNDAKQLEGAKSLQQISGTLKRMPLDYGIAGDSGAFAGKEAQDFLSLVKAADYVPNMDVGSGMYGLLSAMRGNEVAASAFLRQQGVPGVKYLDGGSRGRVTQTMGGDWVAEAQNGSRIGKFPTREQAQAAMEANATRNFVVFPGEEGLLNILERNGGLLGAR